MIRILEFLSNLYWILLPQTIVQTFWRADWKGAYQRNGVSGFAWEGVRSLIGTNTRPFVVPLDGGWSGRDIQYLLAQYDIEMWGWGFVNGKMFFHVGECDADVAQYIMARAGILII